MNDRELARDVLSHCRAIARFTEEAGRVTRTFLSNAMGSCYAYLSQWMETLAMHVEVDAAGNLRGRYRGDDETRRILIGSHLDTVPDAGAYDGVLGVVIAVALIQSLGGQRLPFGIDVIGFSEEEGIRFGFPFVGSRALTGTLDQQTLRITDASGISIEQAIRNFGRDPSRIPEAALTPATRAYLEFHIEQGPVLDIQGSALGVVDAIAGQSRAAATFRGKANHAGTTPMHLRADALCGAAEWIMCIEKLARAKEGLVATVGRIEAKPGATNVIPGEVTATLDVRHRVDLTRQSAFDEMLHKGNDIARRRGLSFHFNVLLDQNAVPMDERLTAIVHRAVETVGVIPYRITSGAGHDAMILAPRLPSAMIFLRSPGGISHHPDETVREEDVAAALRAGIQLLKDLSTCSFLN